MFLVLNFQFRHGDILPVCIVPQKINCHPQKTIVVNIGPASVLESMVFVGVACRGVKIPNPEKSIFIFNFGQATLYPGVLGPQKIDCRCQNSI